MKSRKKDQKTKQNCPICEIQATNLHASRFPEKREEKKSRKSPFQFDVNYKLSHGKKQKQNETRRKLRRPRQCSTSTPKGPYRKSNQKKTIF